jgi:hypothetical protein
LEELEHTGLSPQALTYNNKRFFDWLVRPNDRAVFDTLPTPTQKRATTGSAATETTLNVPFADKDQAKALGAHWHPDQKRWVVPAGLDLEPFKAWLD